jgi:glycosyltransferase involved in cell wall biosynthesis
MENNIRVLVVTNTFPSEARPGDTPSIKDQVEDLEKLGVSIEVLYIDSRQKINYLFGALKIFSLSFMPQKYDIIHAFYGHTGVLAKLQKKYPVVVTFLGSDLLGKKDSKIGKYAASKADGVIVMTNEMKKVSNRSDARVIPFGANTTIFKPYPARQARAELGLPFDKKLVLFPWDPARSVKRYWIAQEVVGLLQSDYDVELLTIFNHPREIIAKYMSACDVMLLTSMHEGAPLAVRESLACRLPVVSVDVGDVRQVVEKTRGGYIASDKAADLAEKVSWVFEQKESLFSTSSKAHGSRDSAQEVLSFYKQMFFDKKR